MELKFFAKPGQNGQVFVGLDSMIDFLRHSTETRPEGAEYKLALLGLISFLEEERVKIKEHQKIIGSVFEAAPPVGAAVPKT